MFQRFHAMRERKESGFTLIELLVVILIIAILAAIAIPVFLRQREKGWIAQMESSLKDAATAAESYATTVGNYAGLTQAHLVTEGWNPTADVTVDGVFVSADNNTWCIQVRHVRYAGNNEPMAMSSRSGAPNPGTCNTTTAAFVPRP